MTLYSHKQNTPDTLPEKIVLSNGFTRTDSSSFTAEEIADAGYVAAPEKPSFNVKTHRCLWVNTNWVVSELPDSEKEYIKEQQWRVAQKQISDCLFTILQCYRQTRQDMDAGKEPLYLLTDIDAYYDKLDYQTIYDAYDATLAQFTVPTFNFQNTNPKWTE
tara:strand:- start:146 stop:628 length:483 start_codon:yes stop_codon:yes gene_type:complete